MARYLWLLSLTLALWFGPAPAQAATRICNDTEHDQQLAISARIAGSWVSEGWELLAPGSCVSVPPEGHSGRFLYFRAESDSYDFRDDSIHFCTQSGRFRIEGGKECVSRGYQEQGFARARLDQPEPSEQPGRDILLSSRLIARSGQISAPSNGRAASQLDASGGTGDFQADVVLRSCQRGNARGITCYLVAEGMQLSTTIPDDGDQDAIAFLAGLPQGAPLRVEGRLLYRFGRSAQLELHNAAPRRANAFDNLRSRLQGEWHSEDDARDHFTIRAVTRQAVIRGRRMAPELISVQPNCAASPQPGQYLVAWEAEGDTSLCYEIVSLTNEVLVLRYLPRGTELRYIRP